MLKEQGKIITIAFYILDLFFLILAFAISYVIRNSFLPAFFPSSFPTPILEFKDYLILLLILIIIWSFYAIKLGLYRSWRTLSIREEVKTVIKISFYTMLTFGVLIFLSRIDEILTYHRFPRSLLALFILFLTLLISGEKLFIRTLSRYLRSRGYNYRTILIVGIGETARKFLINLRRNPHWGFKVVGVLAPNSSSKSRTFAGYPVLGDIDDLNRIVEENVVDDVLFAVNAKELGRLANKILALEELGIRTLFSLDIFPHNRAWVEISSFAQVPVITFSNTPATAVQLFLKRVIDIVVSILLLVMLAPIIMAVAILIKITSRGPVFFKQRRCGLNGREFTLYKFRTMVEDAEKRLEEVRHLNTVNGPAFKAKDDPRVTSIGKFLRRYSLDELPQLWNVLKGDMSLVGPRPPIPDEVKRYKRWQKRRLSMKPGITGLWQVSGRSELDFNEWMALDMKYIDSWSLWLDLKIMIRTVPAILSGKGAH